MLYVVWLLIDNLEFAGGVAAGSPFFKAIPYLVDRHGRRSGWLGVLLLRSRNREVYDAIGRTVFEEAARARRRAAGVQTARPRSREAADAPTLRFEPDAEGDPAALAYTFGGVAPLVSVRPGTVVSTWTHGLLRRPGALDVRPGLAGLRPALPQPADRPVLRRGRRAGRHPGGPLPHASRRATARGVSTTVPLFGSLTATHVHRDAARPAAGADLGLRDRQRGRAWCGTTRSTRRTGRPAAGPDARHGRGRPAARRGPLVADARRAGAATWTPRRCAPARPATSASTSRARCSASATGTPARARARPAASPSSARWTRSLVLDLVKGGPPTAVAAAGGRHVHHDRPGRRGRSRTPSGSRTPRWSGWVRRAHRPVARWTPTSWCRRPR